MEKGSRKSTYELQDGKRRFTRNVVNLVFVVFLVIISIGYTFFMFYRTNSQYDIRLQETGDELAGNIQDQMLSSVEYVQGVAECFSNYEDIHCDEAVETLIRVSSKSRFTRMWLTKTDGKAISSELKESDAAGRNYLERAKNGESGISQVQFSRVNGEKNVVVFAPTWYKGKVTGMVIGILRLDNLFNIIDAECFNGEGRCIIYTDAGDVIVRSDREDQEESSFIQSKYGYSAEIGIMDWNVFVSFPESLIAGEIKDNIIITVVMCIIWAAAPGIILINIFRTRNMEFRRKAQQDSLTLLMNRGTIEKIVETQLQKEKCAQSVFVIFDVDKFKLVNDSVGHGLGDILLKGIAKLMEECFGESDCLGRLGGDEFAVFISEVSDRESLLKRMELFKQKVSEIPIKDMKNSTVSMGIAFSAAGEDNFDSLYQKADRAMYESKSQGGNRITVYKEK